MDILRSSLKRYIISLFYPSLSLSPSLSLLPSVSLSSLSLSNLSLSLSPPPSLYLSASAPPQLHPSLFFPFPLLLFLCISLCLYLAFLFRYWSVSYPTQCTTLFVPFLASFFILFLITCRLSHCLFTATFLSV